MQYSKTQISGDAGEYLLAYKFTHLLGWPCRLYGQDLGVDAEIEILDDAGTSTGDIIKIQIKAVESIASKDSTAIYVDERHIDYWKKFCLPVIVCCVDLSTQKIYWKQVTATEAYTTSGSSRKVSFCLVHDEFGSATKEGLRRLVSPNETLNIQTLFAEARSLVAKLPEENASYSDFPPLEADRATCDVVSEKLELLDGILTSFPWKISAFTLRELNWIRERVRVTKVGINCSYTSLVNGG